MELHSRNDLIQAVNAARFSVRHFVRGLYPVMQRQRRPLPVNRLFFPLSNPSGDACYIRELGQTHILAPGRFYFIPAFYPVAVNLDRNLSFLSIHTSFEILPGSELFAGCARMLNLPAPAEFPALLELFDSEPSALPFSALKCIGILFPWHILLAGHYPEQDFRLVLVLRQFSSLTAYLRDSGNAETRVRDLAGLYRESRETFTRRFTACAGITPKQLIDRFLIGKILQLMGSDCSLKEIAFSLKFSSEFTFSRYFQRQMGVRPSAWRRNAFRNIP